MLSDLGVILNNKIVNDKVLSFHSVFAHVEFQQLGHGIFLAEADAVKTDVGPDEAAEFLRRDFAETFESGDLGIVAEFLDGGYALLVGVAVVGVIAGG